MARQHTGSPQAQVLLAFFLSGAKPADAIAELDKVIAAPQPAPRLSDIFIMRGFLRGTVNGAACGIGSSRWFALTLVVGACRCGWCTGRLHTGAQVGSNQHARIVFARQGAALLTLLQ